MSTPGFTAEVSFGKAGIQYPTGEDFDEAEGITPQLVYRAGFCGPCYWSNGECVKECSNCGYGGCTYWSQPCPTSSCPPSKGVTTPPCCPAGCRGTC